jgi:hypothetical protein
VETTSECEEIVVKNRDQGGVGGYFGARLAAVSEDIHFIARGAHLAALRADGLKLKRPMATFTSSRCPPPTIRRPSAPWGSPPFFDAAPVVRRLDARVPDCNGTGWRTEWS